jgi:hypothetical protein
MDQNILNIMDDAARTNFPDEKSVAESLYQRLEPLALIGMSGQLIAAMLSLGAGIHRLKIAGYRIKFVGGPIICHSRTRELQHHPLTQNEQFKHFIVADRLKWALALTELPVGPTEFAMVMYEASLEAPLSEHMAELYIWATKTAMFRANPENKAVLDSVGSKFPAEAEAESMLSDPMMRLTYFGLANEIQRKVLKHVER